MKLLFKPIPLLLFSLSIWVSSVFLSLIRQDPNQGIIVRNYGIWGDWSAHLAFTEAFRERGLSWVMENSPLFQDAPFRYPFFSHAVTALISGILGLETISGMILTSTILLLVLPFLLFRFFRSLAISSMASLYSTLGFLFMGGFQIFDKALDPSKALTSQFDHGSIVTQLLIYEFFPQRAFLFGICIFLWAIVQLRGSGNWKKALLPMTLLGLLPLVHLHSFFALPFFLLPFLLYPSKTSGLFSNRTSVLRLGIVIAGIGGLCILFLFREKNPNSLSWNLFLPGWAQNSTTGQTAAIGMNPLWFWIYNTGFFLPFALAGIWLHRREPTLCSISISGWSLFLFSLMICVQPYFYDNLKLFTYAFLFLAPCFALSLEWLQKKSGKFGIFLVLILLSIQCSSALLDLRSFQQGIEHATWFGRSEIRLAEEFKKIRRSPDDRVLINPIHNHPIPCLAGNPVVMGYPGWLWSWGIQYGELEKKVASVLLGGADSIQNLSALSPRYIVVNSNEKFQNQPVAISFLDSHTKKILEVDSWQVYQVEPPAR